MSFGTYLLFGKIGQKDKKLKGARHGKKDNDRHPDQQMVVSAICNFITTDHTLAYKSSVDS